MQQIVRGEKNYEFRRYRIASTVCRVWFYLNAPLSHIAYVCEIDSARTRNKGDDKLIENGLGNAEFNNRHPDWKGYDYAYRIRSVYKLRKPITLRHMKSIYGIKGAPRGLIYVPPKLLQDVSWNAQIKILPKIDVESKPSPNEKENAPSDGPTATLVVAVTGGSRKRTRPAMDDAPPSDNFVTKKQRR
ncbi:unnamed protein product [Somion occarium]|uniref:Uncharacterized protein n=1 Tax=Somion occarium TaxID=3059160 RepID=A0ABP1DLJ1_9APHY